MERPVVLKEGLEPSRSHEQQILSLPRLPIPPFEHIKCILGAAVPDSQHHEHLLPLHGEEFRSVSNSFTKIRLFPIL